MALIEKVVRSDPPATLKESKEDQRIAKQDISDTRGHDNGDDTQDVVQDAPLPMAKWKCIALVATVTGAAFLNTLALQSVVIILPTISKDLDIASSRQQWVVSSYSITFACFLLLWGRIGDIYGKRLIFIIGSIWVTVITAVNPFIPNEIAFNIFRALHGLGAAANVPAAIGILGVTFPPGKAKNYAFSTYSAGAPLGSVCGNLLSGLIAQYASWKWVFGACAILAAIISVAGIMFIPPPPPSTILANDTSRTNKLPSVDWIGGTLVTVGLIVLLFSLAQGNTVGWSTPWVPALIVVSIVIIAVFAIWQIYLERRPNGRPPLVRVSIFCNGRFSAVMVVMTLVFASFNNYVIFATYYFQDYQGLDTLHTMLRFIPTGVGGAIIAVIVSQLLSRVPTIFILLTGNVACSVACLLFAVPINPNTTYWAYGFPAMILAVLGADTSWPCLTLFTSQALPPQDQAVGGALINAAGQMGRAIGLAISTAVQTAVMARERGVQVDNAGPVKPWDAPSLAGIRAANWFNFALAIASIFISLMAFRNLEIIGKPKAPPRRTVEDGEPNIRPTD